MYKIAKFEKVSFKEFKKFFEKSTDESNLPLDEDSILQMYNNITLPTRATTGSAGYDFVIPFTLSLNPQESIIIPTGIRVKIDNDWVLNLYPKSGLGFKFRLQLDNTVGIIDSDYYYSDNEGHIMAKITNDSKIEYTTLVNPHNMGQVEVIPSIKMDKIVKIQQGKAFIQGVFQPYGITVDDETTGVRNGGMGSTNS